MFNVEIIGYISGPNKDATLVKKGSSTVRINFIQSKNFKQIVGINLRIKLSMKKFLDPLIIERSLGMGSPHTVYFRH